MTGFDPEVTRYFKKIINSFSFGFLWLFAIATSGIYFRLAFISRVVQWYNVLFYIGLPLSLIILVRYYYKLWK